MTDTKPVSPEEGFRSSLRDTIEIIRGLASVCKTPEEMIEVARLGLENDGQLRLLMGLVVNAQKNR